MGRSGNVRKKSVKMNEIAREKGKGMIVKVLCGMLLYEVTAKG